MDQLSSDSGYSSKDSTHSRVDRKLARKLGKRALREVLKTDSEAKSLEKVIRAATRSSGDALYLKVIYQIIGDLISGVSVKTVIQIVHNAQFGWDHTCYTEIKKRIAEQDHFIVHPYEVEEGVGKCPKCGYTKAYTATSQTRGCDEPATTFYRCANIKCKATWIYNG
jgi:DNA-directed RNA polymerase subunit M/transcription elongation factor TFIIS